jgi:MFS family permease
MGKTPYAALLAGEPGPSAAAEEAAAGVVHQPPGSAQTHRGGSVRHGVPVAVAVVLGLCCALDAADGVLLPTLFRALERGLGITPAQLGLLSLVKSMAMALSYPLWGHAADALPKTRLLACAVLGWAAASWLVGLAGSIATFAAAVALIGLGRIIAWPHRSSTSYQIH